MKVNGIADNVTKIGGKNVAVEAKFVADWSTSIRNPASSIGSKPFAVAEQAQMLEQAKKYSATFDEVIYHSNSPQLIAYYAELFKMHGLRNIRFILTKWGFPWKKPYLARYELRAELIFTLRSMKEKAFA